MSNEELREALQIGLEWARSYCTRPADDHPDVRKIEAAIASLPTIKDCLTVAPTFDQTEHDTMVEKGTQAWADPADYPERCKVDPLQSLADQAQELNMGYDDVIDLAQAKRLITQLRARILELSKLWVTDEPLEPWRDIANALPRLQAWRDGAGAQELGVGYYAGSDEFAYDVCSLLSAHKELLQIISAKDSS